MAAKTKTAWPPRLEAIRADFNHRTQVLIEEFLTSQRLMAEGQVALEERLTRKIDQRFLELSSRIDLLEKAVRAHSVQIAELRAAVQQNTADIRQNTADIKRNSEDIRRNSEDIKRMAKEIAQLRRALNATQKRARGKADGRKLTLVTRRVAALETRLKIGRR